MERKIKVGDSSSMDDDEDNICPAEFRCPISMELMKDPVTICTGVTYDRKNIEKWFFAYKKKICPATMQSIHSFDVTPNHTLNRLILDWQLSKQYNQQHDSYSPSSSSSSSSSPSPSSSSSPSVKQLHDEMLSLLHTIDSSPFKVTPLRKLRSILEMGDHIHPSSNIYMIRRDFIRFGGVEVLVQILVQILVAEISSEFVTFRACEEALGVLHLLPLIFSQDSNHQELEERAFQLLSKPESMKSIAIVLQKGSAEARFYTISIFRKMAKNGYDWNGLLRSDHLGGGGNCGGVDLFKSLLEIVSDEICSKASSCALEVLIQMLDSSKKSRLRAIEAGAVCVLIELLPDSNGSKCEKILLLIKLLCECAEGRLALVEHAMGIASVSKKLLHVSNTATKLGVKIFTCLLSSFHPTERVLEELLICGSVKKLVGLLHMDGRSSTKDKVIKMFKLHGNSWMRYPCFPRELKDYLGLVNNA
ncbi:unnamed protein product [Dovyalis caffra]|uniref:U-box domain-containing protein n=1 Tax=Dovyalis caffra TaxID=77055 RepID=A0AAV1SCT3_9ROSI|nr:unnamed protein product [Dovyalis caffra]